MSKLDELLRELCPDGVETKKLKDFLVIKTEVIIRALAQVITLYMVRVAL